MPGSGLTTFNLLNTPIWPHTATYVGSRWIKFTVPLTATLFVGSVMSCIIARLRGNKDDSWNYMLGAMTTAPIWTAFLRNSGTGTAAAVGFGLAAVFLKIHDQHDAIFTQVTAVDGRAVNTGSFGGQDWGDLRWLTPKLIQRDPGRRPTF